MKKMGSASAASAAPTPAAPAPSLRFFAATGVGGVLQAAAALLWLPQAALLAWAVQRMSQTVGHRGDTDVAGLAIAAHSGSWTELLSPALSAVLAPALGILALGLLRALLDAWGTRQLFGKARAHLSILRARAAAALASGSPLDRHRPASGAASSVIAEQAEALMPYLVRYQPVRLRVTLVPLVILVVVASLSWVAALVLLVAAPLIPVFMALVGWRARAASEAQMVEMGSMNAFLLDRLRGLATLRALGAVDRTAERLGDAAQSLRRRTMAVLRIAFLSSAVLELFSALGVAMVAAYVGFHLLGTLHFGTWGRPLGLGQGLFVLLLAPAFFEPLRELSAVWHDRAAGEVALQALTALGNGTVRLPGAVVSMSALAADPAPVRAIHAVTAANAASSTTSVNGKASSPHSAPSVVVRHLHFTHVGEATLFSDINLRVAPGEHVALVGESGAGKTALLSLLAGLLPADSGDIVIGGTVLTDRSVGALRQRIGWMGQRPHVFAGSVQSNVGLGRIGVDAARIETSLGFAGLADVAQARLGVALGEGGGGLSGGEAVRLALARVVVNAGVDLLLVDEPTAHLDTETSLRVTDALMALARGKTLIVATHDPVLAARLDRVVSLGAADTFEVREVVREAA
nr:thiol reductant ABC exporter subunit CydD [Variovorax sp. PAMC28562]